MPSCRPCADCARRRLSSVKGCAGGSGKLQLWIISEPRGVFIGTKRVGETGSPKAS